MRTDDIAWADLPPEEPHRWLPIYSAKAYGSFKLVVLSHRVVGVITHWWDGRTIPCRKVTGDCVCLRWGARDRWKGYLGCWEPQFSRCCILEITEDAAYHSNIPLRQEGLDLRGLLVSVRRLGKAKNAPARVEFSKLTVELECELPPIPNVEGALLHLWEGKSRDEECEGK